MYTSKSTQVLDKHTNNISPITCMESVYLECKDDTQNVIKRRRAMDLLLSKDVSFDGDVSGDSYISDVSIITNNVLDGDSSTTLTVGLPTLKFTKVDLTTKINDCISKTKLNVSDGITYGTDDTSQSIVLNIDDNFFAINDEKKLTVNANSVADGIKIADNKFKVDTNYLLDNNINKTYFGNDSGKLSLNNRFLNAFISSNKGLGFDTDNKLKVMCSNTGAIAIVDSGLKLQYTNQFTVDDNKLKLDVNSIVDSNQFEVGLDNKLSLNLENIINSDGLNCRGNKIQLNINRKHGLDFNEKFLEVNIATDGGLDFDGNGGLYIKTTVPAESDIRLKTEIKPIDDYKLPEIKQFVWKDSSVLSYGFIAQELETTHPELVFEREDGIKTVNYNGALSYLVSYLIDKVNVLENKIKTLESK